jgi:hypothetical protein
MLFLPFHSLWLRSGKARIPKHFHCSASTSGAALSGAADVGFFASTSDLFTNA